MVDLLHVIVIVQAFEKLFQLLRKFKVVSRVDGGLRQTRELGGEERITLRLQRLAHGGKIARSGVYLVDVVERLEIFRAGVQRRHHKRVLVDL